MMPVVRIPDSVFERLQAIAKPFVDSPASVIERLLDFYDSREVRAQNAPHKAQPIVTVTKDFEPHNPPSLKHTRRVDARIGGLKASSWNELVHMAHRAATAKLGDLGFVKKITRSNIIIGRRDDNGFQYISDINLSIQNVDADKAWRNALHLAQKLGLDISVEFEWPDTDGAAMPGKRGRLLWAANQV
jgi:hypothetical protein